MQTETTSYRLERWIAFFLGLLFFLPFVAKGDDLLFTASFHGDEVRYKSGEKFLALVCKDAGSCALQPVKIEVNREFDGILDAEGEETGKRVTAIGAEEAFLIRGKNLHPGPVTPATPSSTEILPIGAAQRITLGSETYTLQYRCGSKPDPDGMVDCALVLERGTTTQVLATFPAIDENGKINSLDVEQSVAFAGDLDRDGRLDLVANVSGHWNEWHPALYLSSAAGDGELVRKVAEMITTGC
jgi:hypothetical protein